MHTENGLERTLVLLKPDAIDRGIVGEVMTRFERVGLKMVGLKMLVSEKDTAEKHYTEDLARRRGEAIRNLMISMLTSGPIIALALEGVDAVEVVRKMIGATEPKAAAPGTIRGDYTHVSYRYADAKGMGIFNLIHASDSSENAQAELSVWFKPEELVSHKPGYTKMTLRED
ncbi:MAG: nucleoside-diphosphate kinase [Candidatus Paceibacterota bacterium]|nr:MAG: nucleoside-diphosphate kinase [Candidatus Paceibacterota bacterium]